MAAGVAMLATACGGGGGGGSSNGASGGQGNAHKGGTLKMVGNGQVDHLDTASGYYDVTYMLDTLFTRQLYTFPTGKTLQKQQNPVPDLATAMPKKSNGGKTYTITIRKGAKWDTNPPRQVTAKDEIRGLKRLCNPVQPSGALGYYEATIKGFKSYCERFLKAPAKVPAIKKYIQSHDVSGLKALGKRKIQITLNQPASDFIDIISLPFASPAPKEYLNYKPDGPKFRENTISDGPYKITTYKAGHQIVLERNKAWDPKTDPVRKAYVDKVQITEGVNDASTALQRIKAGSADMFWDQVVPAAQLAGLRKSNDPNLVIGPNGDNYLTINPYMAINLQSPNNGGALKKLKVRKALEYAFNKQSVSQKYGGKAISEPLNQVIPKGSVGHIDGYNPYPTKGNEGNPAKSKKLLKQAGYKPGEITLKYPFRPNSVHPQVATANKAALQKAGFKVKLIPLSSADAIYTKYLQSPSASKNGAWDIAAPGWIPDWLGNNGRSVIEPLFDGRHYQKGSTDYGDYNNKKVNSEIDKALSSKSQSEAKKHWQAAAKQVMQDAVIVPLGAQKVATYHSSRLQGCHFYFVSENCDPPNVWIK
jgi:peptide/nickel transport system substrate-binding protein